MINTRLLLLLILCTGATVLVPSQSKSDGTKTLVVMIDHNSSGFIYRVDGKPATADFLTYLEKRKSDWPSEKTKVVLLVHERATLAMINNSRGMIMKAGYEPPRVFHFGSDKRLMVELIFTPAVPFSQSGAVSTPR